MAVSISHIHYILKQRSSNVITKRIRQKRICGVLNMHLVKKLREKYHNLYKMNEELLWAQIWNDTKNGLEWMKDIPSISPGRWAVGYNYLYVMLRALESLQPKAVLDIGLGISSTLISHYCYKHPNVVSEHLVIEQDQQWADFYTKKVGLSNESIIKICEVSEKTLDGHAFNAYKGLEDALQNRKFTIISIDAPKGSEMYSRRDVIPLIPYILEKSFLIIIDDVEREGERRTADDICLCLERNNIAYKRCIYSGMSDVCVIVSEDNSFLCSL